MKRIILALLCWACFNHGSLARDLCAKGAATRVDQAAVIFSGRVVEQKPPDYSIFPYRHGLMAVSFEIVRVFRGAALESKLKERAPVRILFQGEFFAELERRNDGVQTSVFEIGKIIPLVFIRANGLGDLCMTMASTDPSRCADSISPAATNAQVKSLRATLPACIFEARGLR